MAALIHVLLDAGEQVEYSRYEYGLAMRDQHILTSGR